MMETITIVLVMAVLVEAIVQVIKGWVPESANTPAWLWPVVGAVLGVGVCVTASVDVFVLLGITLSVPLVGPVVTGILISRGASFVHDLWGKIKGEGMTTE